METSYRERVQAALAQLAAAKDDAIFTRLYTESALAAASAADDRKHRGTTLGSLDGCIVSIKDLFDIAGEATTAGSFMLRNSPPAKTDAIAVRRLREAGAIVLGKTNMTEFAYSGLGLNPHWGTPRNAVDPERIPGGSSSGAAVSVAIGVAEIAIGSDTGGSVRIPAALNGIVGFKPSADSIPREGVFPLSYSLDSVGPLARTVQRCADAFSVMARRPPRRVQSADLSSVRIGIAERFLDDIESAVSCAFICSVRELEKAQAVVEAADIDGLIVEMRTILSEAPIVPVEAAEIHWQRLKSSPSEFDPKVLARILQGTQIIGPRYLWAIRSRNRLIAAMDQRLRSWDCLILPTTPRTAPLMAEVADPEPHERLNALMLRNPGFVNFFDLCAVSLPMPAKESPAGIMFVARHGQDSKLLSIARAFEVIGEQHRAMQA